MDMKYVCTFLFLAAIAGTACKGKNNTAAAAAALQKVQADTANYTDIQWLDSMVNFGSIRFGEHVNVQFRFKNTGNKPLIITNVVASCGCTVPDFTKTPVAPGAEGMVTGAFDSNRAHPGTVRKTIMVTANTRNKQQFELIFNGDIKEKDAQ